MRFALFPVMRSDFWVSLLWVAILAPAWGATPSVSPSIAPSLPSPAPRPSVLPSSQPIPGNAANVLTYVSNARDDLSAGRYDAAKANLKQAQDQLGTLRSQNLALLYSSLSYAEGYAPSDADKRQLRTAEESLRNGNTSAAVGTLQQINASAIYTKISLPVRETQNNLSAAILALNQSDPRSADLHLQSVEDDVQISITQLNPKPAPSGGGK